MKKILIWFVFALLLLISSPSEVQAGPQCSTQGGYCEINCPTNRKNVGKLDCPGAGGRSPGETCCVNDPNAKNAGESGNSVTCQNGTGINTAIGCVPALSSSSDLMSFILKWAIGVGGGIAFLLILFSGFQIMTSQGDPQRLKAGQELLTAAISGVIMLIFSVFILRVIGVNILGIF